MKTEFLNAMRDMAKVDVEKSPNFIVVKTMYKKLRSVGFTDEMASVAVTNMDIKVSKEFIDDKELLEEATDLYAKTIYRLYVGVKSIGSSFLFVELLKNSKMLLHYEE